jgi:DNA-binding GntR family transcriptional regulator
MGTQPLHAQVTDALAQRIRRNEWPLGSTLPPEKSLAAELGVSRHTLRHALSTLRDKGLVQMRQGAGTRVISATEPRVYSQDFNALRDVLRYPSDTVRENLRESYIECDGALQSLLQSPIGSSWYHIEAVRRDEASGQPVSWSDIYIQSQFAKVTKMRNHQREIVFEQIERYFGVSIDRAVVEVQAESLSAVHARHLQALRGSPSLAITRRYYDQSGQVFEVTVTRHVPDRFQFALELRSVGRTRVVSETHDFS